MKSLSTHGAATGPQVSAAVHEPEYDEVADPALPRVLIIGDSISIGYTPEVREFLADRVNVHSPAANCGATFIGLRDLSKWLAGKKWDVIHFNFGLHDLRYCFDGDPYKMEDEMGRFPTAETGSPRTSLADYENNLRVIVEKLKATGAALIWASTTPIGQYYHGYDPVVVKHYNAAAARVMTEMNVTINDLNAAMSEDLATLQDPDHVHFNQLGRRRQAEEVAQAIRNPAPTDL